MKIVALGATTAAREVFGPLWGAMLLRGLVLAPDLGEQVDMLPELAGQRSALDTLVECVERLGCLDGESSGMFGHESPWRESCSVDWSVLRAELMLAMMGVVSVHSLAEPERVRRWALVGLRRRSYEVVTGLILAAVGRGFRLGSYRRQDLGVAIDTTAALATIRDAVVSRGELIHNWLASSSCDRLLAAGSGLSPESHSWVVGELDSLLVEEERGTWPGDTGGRTGG